MLEAVFITGVDEITVTGLAQWDRGQVLKITYPSIPPTFQVHFANKNSEKAMVIQAESEDNTATVAIPDELLRESLELFAWLYFDESLTGETAGTVRMPVKARTKPDDYVIELPQEQATAAEKIVMKLMDEYTTSAAESAAAAQASAEAAKAAKTEAVNAAAEALNAKTAAKNYLTQTLAAKDETLEHESYTRTHRNAANASATRAATSESNATASANEAKGYRDEVAEMLERMPEGGTAEGAVLYTAQTLTEAQKAQARANIGAMEAITPQMFGAVGDGVADDTAAVQAALDRGGLIYFPAGRYKVTSLLTASKSCRIEMFKQYPSFWKSGDTGDYPLTADDNWMGSRIESYSQNGGMKLGSCVEVDGLYLRAMSEFAGVLLTYEDTDDLKNYPATTRLSHIRLDIDVGSTIPTSMFDFTPNGSYNYILDDITIGRMLMTFCEYGFRADVSKTSAQWANSVYVRNLCIDLRADYPLYVVGSDHTSIWQFDGLNIQTYPYDTVTNGRTKHADIVTLKKLQTVLFTSCNIWDLVASDYTNIFVTSGLGRITCVGCGTEFEQIETEFSAKMAMAKNFNIKSLQMSLVTDADTGDNTLTLSDGTNKKQAVIPAATLSDEQVSNGVENWMDENAAPSYVVGKNKLNMSSEENTTGYYDDSTGKYTTATTTFLSHYIPVKNGDVVRMYQDGTTQIGWWRTYLFDADKKWLGYGVPSSKALTLNNENVAYIRQCITMSGLGVSTIEAFKELKITLTLNSTDKTYEPYTVTAEGGLTSYLVLSSPDGKKYSLAVDGSGLVIASPINGGEAVTPGATVTDEDKAAIVSEVLSSLTSEDWVFTLEDGSTLTKKVVLK